VTERAFSDGSSFAFSYDTEGRRVGASSLRGGTYGSFLYGARTYGSDAEETTFEYDANGHLTSLTYPGDHTLGFAWDDAGRLSSLTDIHGTATAYGYDAANRLTTVTRTGKTTTCQYDGAGRLASLAYPNGVTCDFTYDHDSRVTRMLWEKGATLLYHLEYRYDRAGNRTRRMVTKSPEAALIEDFNYDALSRLVRVDENGSLRAHYKYDPAGNRLLKKRPPTLTSPGDGVVVDNDELYEYDASDELVAMNSTRFRWDRVGQLIEKDDPSQANPTRYEWSAAHRLSKVILPDLTSAEYRYNGDELRTWRREPSGAETNYDWVPSGILGLSQVLNETDGTGTPKASYVLGPNGLIAIVDGDGHERYYVFDALGSVLALTDETGAVTDTYVYDEYGVPVSTSGEGKKLSRYASLSQDAETSLYYARHRYYDPARGQFVRRDPLGVLDRDFPYRYGRNSPANFVDPDGLYVNVCYRPLAGGMWPLGYHTFIEINGKTYSYGAKRGDITKGEIRFNDYLDSQNWGHGWGRHCVGTGFYNLVCDQSCLEREIKKSAQNPPDYDLRTSTCYTWVEDMLRKCCRSLDPGRPITLPGWGN